MTAAVRKRTVAVAATAEETQELARVASLTSLIAALKAPGERTREQFSALFAKAQRVFELDDIEVARALHISRPTVGRWARGESAPHTLGRKPALLWLARQGAHKLTQHG
ncbi:MAG: hypothetical protein Q8O67_30450 [Deltaproteobacteria bacterium]|nr:hypothetical protein [Deltaproteobacteria bacterium]